MTQVDINLTGRKEQVAQPWISRLCKEFDVDVFKDGFDVADAISDGYIQVCDDGIIVWAP